MGLRSLEGHYFGSSKIIQKSRLRGPAFGLLYLVWESISSGSNTGLKQLIKKKANAQRIAHPSRALGFMPDEFTTTLRYSEFMTITATTGALARYEFIANGLYDPNFTGTGHQPYGFDQLIALYSYAVVHGCKAKVTCHNPAGYESMYVLLQQGPSVLSLPSGIGEAIERCPTDEWGVTTAYSPLRLKASGTTAEYLGVPRSQQLAETNLYSSSAANPALYWYVRLFTQPTDGASTAYLRALVELEFEVTFVKPIQAVSS